MSNSNKLPYDVIVLAAGRPHRGETPAVLEQASVGRRVLDWMLESYGATPADVTFLAGYQADTIRHQYPGLRLIINQEWSKTGSLHSLSLANVRDDRPLFVNYGDVLVRSNLLRAMTEVDADIVIAVDSLVGSSVSGGGARSNKTLREWVMRAGGQATRIGYDLAPSWADGEFVGVVHFRPEAFRRLCDCSARLGPRAALPEGLEYLRARGERIAIVDALGQWVEVIDAKDIATFVLGTKADTLQRLRGVLNSGQIQEVGTFTVDEWRADPAAILSALHTQFGQRFEKLVVRSSARSEDNFHSSNAGGYDSVLNVDPVTGLQTAITQVIASYGEAAPDDQVLVQPMLKGVRLSGVAFTRTAEHYAPWYVINYETSGRTDGVTSGMTSDHLTLHVRRDSPMDRIAVPELRSLVATLREIEDRVGYDALDIEFAVDDQGIVHVFQVRPIAIKRKGVPQSDAEFDAAIRQAVQVWIGLAQSPPQIPGDHAPVYSVMTDWNPAEIIGTAPGRLAETLYRFLIMDSTWATQRSEYGYRDLRPAPLLVSFAGRPYVDVRASLASFIPASLDDDLAGRLLGHYLGTLRKRPELHDKVEFDIVPTCLAPDFPTWAGRLETEGGFSAAEIDTLRQALHAITQDALTRCSNDLAQLEILEARRARIAASSVTAIERARLLLEECRRFGTLPFAHLARSGFVAVTLLRGAESTGAISAGARASFMSTIRSVSHDFSTDATAVASGALSWEDFVGRYGHLRPGTYDIASPRYDADPERFLRPQVEAARDAAVGAEAAHHSEDSASAWRRERPAFMRAMAEIGLEADIDQIETFLRQGIEGREYSKFIFTRAFSDAIEALAEAGAARGLSTADLAELPLDALLSLRDDSVPEAERVARLRELAEQNRALRALTAAMKLPPVIIGPQDFDAFVIGAELANFVGQREVVAECVDLEHATADSMPDVKGRIAMIPQADPGYDWLFGQGIIGLVTMYGGANSHMAIRAAEFGMPAAIGVGEQRYRQLSGVTMLQIDPLNQVLRAIS